LNVVDSSGWLEFFKDGPNKGFFKPAIQVKGNLVIPVLTIFEVFKKYLLEGQPEMAHRAIAFMEQGSVVDLTPGLAKTAAQLGVENKLPMADSVILATAYANKATLWTQDADFEDLPGVKFCPR